MTFYTINEMRAEARAVSRFDTAGAEGVLRKSAASTRGPFDVFLSHSFRDAEVILGVKRTLERAGKKVYVDWIDDPLLDRRNVTPSTAHQLRVRMDESASLIFATSEASSASKWMPWELGYFDGHHGSARIAIMPIVAFSGEQFVGQEYLGLYPLVEELPDAQTGVRRPLVARRSRFSLETKSLDSLVNGWSTYTTRESSLR